MKTVTTGYFVIDLTITFSRLVVVLRFQPTAVVQYEVLLWFR